MATVQTTTQTAPLVYPGVSRIARSRSNGYLWTAILDNAGTGVGIYRSTNNGASWALFGSWSKGLAILELSGLVIDNSGSMHLAYRTNESSQDRIYWRRMVPAATLQTAEVLVGNPANGGVAGAIHTGVDLQVVLLPDATSRVAVGVGTVVSGRAGVTLYGAWMSSTGVLRADNAITGGTRQWLFTGTGRITPQLDIEHNGDAKTAPSAPHLWVSFGRTDIRLVKCAWANSRWSGPTSAITLKPGLAAQDAMPGRWDGSRFLQAAPNPDTGLTDTVLITERNRANSATVWRTTPVHPTGVVRHCTISYNSVNGDFRVYAVGTSTTVLYYCDFIRATSTFTAWTQVTATAVIGATGNNYGARRETFGSARYDVLHAEGVTPFTIVHTSQTVTYPPDVPTWQYGTSATTPPANGAAMDVAAALLLDWAFTDPDPADAQSAWALSRQIGVAALQYWRASDSTWQAAEVQNPGATTQVSLSAAQWVGAGGATDLPHSYKVKVWDGASTASLYSGALVVVPSAKVNPTVTAPAAAAVLTTDTVTATWTVAEQSAYRVTLATNPGGVLTWDTGWIGSAQLSYTPPVRLPDLTGWTITVQTRNLEGLPSNVVSVNFTVDYLEPAVPTLVVTPVPAAGVITVAITNPVPGGGQPALADQDLYRRRVGDTDEGVRIAAGLASGASRDDWQAASGVPYEYRALARGNNGTSIYSAWTA